MPQAEALADLTRAVATSLATYSNVHRGSGHYSVASTRLYEKARAIVLEHLGLRKGDHVVVFCTPRRAAHLTAQLQPGAHHRVSSADLGLPLGVTALAIERRSLPRAIPFLTGGGTARLVSKGWIVWARPPDRFEAGTPAIVNVIAMAKALTLVRRFGPEAFRSIPSEPSNDALSGLRGSELLAALRRTLIGLGATVPTFDGPRPFVNLDNAASTPTFAPIWDAVRSAWSQPPDVQQSLVREARSVCARFLGAPPDGYDVIFTSNTTEAVNLVAESLSKEFQHGGAVVLNTLLEHNSNELPWRTSPGLSLVRLPVDREGFIDLSELEATLRWHNLDDSPPQRRIRLVSVSGASNVLGVFNDLDAISQIVHRYGARLLVDAAQLVAHRRVSMDEQGIDYLAFSAHKAYAPFGTGALVARKGQLAFSPSELEQIRSSGEENVGGIAALGKAFELLERIGLDVIREEEQALTTRALRGLAEVPGLTLYGTKDVDSPRFASKGGVIAFNLKGMMADRTAGALAERGIGVRWGCHCAHMFVKHMLGIHPVLEQLQGILVRALPWIALPGVVRASFGIQTCPEDVDALVQALKAIAAARGGLRGASKSKFRDQLDGFTEAAARSVYGEPDAVAPIRAA